METETAHPPLTRRPPLASSWDAACGALAQSLHLTRSDLGTRDADWEELLAPPATGEHEKIILYKKYLKLESSTHACKIKLLSFGEKQCAFISKVVVHVRPVSANSSAGCPALGSRIDLERVQTIMESLGSKLSPGAQQLMNMVRFQQ
ncbi:hypothetical protein EI555_008892, partial [Monodon monoceros]